MAALGTIAQFSFQGSSKADMPGDRETSLDFEPARQRSLLPHMYMHEADNLGFPFHDHPFIFG